MYLANFTKLYPYNDMTYPDTTRLNYVFLRRPFGCDYNPGEDMHYVDATMSKHAATLSQLLVDPGDNKYVVFSTYVVRAAAATDFTRKYTYTGGRAQERGTRCTEVIVITAASYVRLLRLVYAQRATQSENPWGWCG